MKMKRMTLDLSEETMKKLEDLSKQMEISKSEALRRAIGLLDIALDDDKEIIVEEVSTKEKYKLLLF